MADRILLVGPALEDLFVDEHLQSLGQDVATKLELGLDVLETPDAAKVSRRIIIVQRSPITAQVRAMAHSLSASSACRMT